MASYRTLWTCFKTASLATDFCQTFIHASGERPGCILQGAGGAVAGAGSILGGRIALSARCIDHAADRAAAAAKRSVRARAGQVMHATDSSACWLRKKAKVASWSLFCAGCLARALPRCCCVWRAHITVHV